MTRPLALVTGASSGIGEAFARRLAADGYDLVVVARREARLKALAQELAPASVRVVSADLGTEAGIEEVAAEAGNLALDLLVNNAGLAYYMPFVELPPASATELLRVNVVAPTLIARAALPGMVQRGKGAVVNLASLLAFSGASENEHLPRRAVYAGTRSYIVVFSQVLAREVAGSGVRVQALCPGIVTTEFHTRQGIDTASMPPGMDPADVVTASLAALEMGEIVCAPGVDDDAAIARAGEAGLAVLSSSAGTSLAERYR